MVQVSLRLAVPVNLATLTVLNVQVTSITAQVAFLDFRLTLILRNAYLMLNVLMVRA